MKHTVLMFGRVSTAIKAGIPAHVLSIAKAYEDDSGYEFINLVPSLKLNSKTRVSYVCRNFIEYECASVYSRKTFAFSLALYWYTFLFSFRYKHATVHLHLPDPLSLLACLLFLSNRKIIATYHADLLDKGLFSFINRLLIYCLSRLQTTFVVPTGKHYDSTLLSSFMCDYRVVPFIFQQPVIASDYRMKLSSSYTRFLFVGRLVSYKGVEYLISAFNMFKDHENVSLDIVGCGELYPVLCSLAQSNTKISLHGFLNDVELARFYEKSHVFCLPSISKAEAFGIVQVEAMLRHCLCISSELGNGVNEVNKNNISGLSVPAADSYSLFKAMESVHHDKELRNRLMASAYKYATQKFASQATKSYYDALYRN
jgi:glycosyltransferase involved in cell wall biosynthesis